MRLGAWLKSLRQRRILLTGRRSLGYVLSALPVMALAASPCLLWTSVVVALVKARPESVSGTFFVVVAGCAVLAASFPLLAMPLAEVERRRLRLVDARPISEAAVGKHVGNILAKLDLPPAEDTNRRGLAVLTYLRS